MRTAVLLLLASLAFPAYCAAATNAPARAVAVTSASVTSHPGTGILSLRTPDGELITLVTKGFSGELKWHPDGPLQWLPVVVPNAEAACASFGVDDGQGQARFVGVLLAKTTGAKWRIVTEWLAECGPLDELSFKREKQNFTTPAAGSLLRSARKYKSEGHTFKLDCGCNVCQSATFDYMENETWNWSPTSATFERKNFERAYIVQYGEGLMAVARKALGDARLMSRLYRLNPEIKPGGMLKEGQQIVFERIAEPK